MCAELHCSLRRGLYGVDCTVDATAALEKCEPQCAAWSVKISRMQASNLANGPPEPSGEPRERRSEKERYMMHRHHHTVYTT